MHSAHRGSGGVREHVGQYEWACRIATHRQYPARERANRVRGHDRRRGRAWLVSGRPFFSSFCAGGCQKGEREGTRAMPAAIGKIGRLFGVV